MSAYFFSSASKVYFPGHLPQPPQRILTQTGIWLFFIFLLMMACQRPQLAVQDQKAEPSPEEAEVPWLQALEQIEPERIKGHLNFLAADLLEGRLPGTRGFDIAAMYVETQFMSMGLEPAGVNGTYRQTVPLVGSSSGAQQNSFVIQNKNGDKKTLRPEKDFLMMPNTRSALEELQGPVVFIGYGVHAPEIGYDDFEGVDVRGKVVALFRGLPATFPDSVMGYYGAKKWDDIIKMGAVGMIYLNRYDDDHDYWNYYKQSAAGTEPLGNWGWVDQDGTITSELIRKPDLKIWAELTQNAAQMLFADAPVTLEEAYSAVNGGTTLSQELPVNISLHQQTKYTHFSSDNVMAVLPGADPVLKNEYVVYVAHLDHTGIGTPIEGDSIYNGAQDNASGTAIMLEVARAFKRMPEPPKRSILFIGVTAEEAGLLGSEYFVAYPTVPAGNIVAAMSMDMALMLHPIHDIIAIGSEFSSLIGPVKEAARHLNLEVSPDPMPEEQFFERSDQYSFVRKGIPALMINNGYMTGDPAINGKEIDSTWLKTIYHSPLDNPNQAFDWNTAVKLAQINCLVGFLIANDPKRPVWNPDSEYAKKLSMK